MTNCNNFYYDVMPFGLKNTKETYPRLMDSVFAEQIGRNLEVYIKYMVYKALKGQHKEDLKEALASVKKYNTQLNTSKCSFGVQANKFLGFMMTN